MAYPSQIKPAQKKNFILGLVGDSRSQNAGLGGASENRGVPHWACLMSGQRLQFDSAYNFGVGGYTTKDIIDNKLSAACASLPSSFLVLCGTNDRVSMSAGDTARNIDTIVRRLTDAGKDVYLMAEMPRGDTTFTGYRLSQPQLVDHMAVRRHILSLRGMPNVFVCDPWEDMCVRLSTTGDLRPGLSIDGLHPNARGAYYAAKSVAAQIIGRHPVAPSLTPRHSAVGDWLNANPLLDGVGGTTFGTGGSGQMATSWRASIGGTVGLITRTYSKTPEGYQQIVIGGGKPTGNKPQLDLLQQVNLHSGINPGRRIQAVAEMSLSANAVNVISLQLGVMVKKADSSLQYVSDGDAYDDASFVPAESFGGVYLTPPILVTPGALDVRVFVRAYCSNITPDTSQPSGTVVIKNIGLMYTD